MVTIILILGLGASAFCAVLVLALGRVAAGADRELEELAARRRAASGAVQEGHAVLALIRPEAGARHQPAAAAPAPSRASVATRRLPVSFTS